MFQQVHLADDTLIGVPGPLPDVIATWGDAPDLLADLTGHVDSQFGLDGTGFWPVVTTMPAYDATKQVPDGTFTVGAPDPATRTVPATANVRPLTTAEIAAMAPPPRIASATQIRYALNSFGIRAAFEKVVAADSADTQDWWEYKTSYVENATKLIRICSDPTVTTTPKTLFDKALTF